MNSWHKSSQNLALVAGTACIVAVAIAWAVHLQKAALEEKGKKRKKRDTVNASMPAIVEVTTQNEFQVDETEQDVPVQAENFMASFSTREKDPESNTASERSINPSDAGSSYSDHVADEVPRLDSGIGSPKGTPQLEKARFSLGNHLEAFNNSSQAHDLIEESLSAVCFASSPLPAAAVKPSSTPTEDAEVPPAEVTSAKDEITAEDAVVSEDKKCKLEDTYATEPKPVDEVQQQPNVSVEKHEDPVLPEQANSTSSKNPVDQLQPKTNAADEPVPEKQPLKDSKDKQKDDRAKGPKTHPHPMSPSNNKHSNNNNHNNNNNISQKTSRKSPEQSKKRVSEIPDQANGNKRESTDVQSPSTKNGSRSGKRVNTSQQGNMQAARSNTNHKDEKLNGPRRHSSGSDAAGDDKSDGSADSGQGGSDCPAPVVPTPTVFEFDLPSDLCGRLIGRQGATVKAIKHTTGATISVRNHVSQERMMRVYVLGAPEDVRAAIQEIRKKFPRKTFPQVNLETPPPVQLVQLPMSAGGVEVHVCALEAANRMFLQLVRNFRVLEAIQESLAQLYGPESIVNAPPLGVLCPGSICISVQDTIPYRAVVIGVVGLDQVKIKYVDAGGFGITQVATLRQIRSDMLTYPLQAVEVLLANVEPVNGIAFTEEAMASTHQFLVSVQSEGRLLAQVVSYEGEIACVDLVAHMRDQSIVSLGDYLVQQGHARVKGVWSGGMNEELVPPGVQAPTFSPADFPQLAASQQNGGW